MRWAPTAWAACLRDSERGIPPWWRIGDLGSLRACRKLARVTCPGDTARVEQIPLSRVLAALSFALDLTEGEPPGHASRTAKIGMRLADAIGLDADARSDLFYALLLKDAGCSANSAKMAALFGADDHVAKRTSKRVDWSGRLPAFIWA